MLGFSNSSGDKSGKKEASSFSNKRDLAIIFVFPFIYTVPGLRTLGSLSGAPSENLHTRCKGESWELLGCLREPDHLTCLLHRPLLREGSFLREARVGFNSQEVIMPMRFALGQMVCLLLKLKFFAESPRPLDPPQEHWFLTRDSISTCLPLS